LHGPEYGTVQSETYRDESLRRELYWKKKKKKKKTSMAIIWAIRSYFWSNNISLSVKTKRKDMHLRFVMSFVSVLQFLLL
jgi:hypothetical protein